jgi:hypothetical protein
MEIKNPIEVTVSVDSPRSFTVRTAVASLALATATIPAIAGNGSETSSKDDSTATRVRAAKRKFHYDCSE